MTGKSVLVIDEMHSSLKEMLKEIGYQCDYRPEITRLEILNEVHGHEGLIVRSKTAIDREIIDSGSKLKFIARAGAGLEKMDLPLLDERGIKVFNAPEGNRHALGEHSIGMILTLFNNLRKADDEIRAGKWDREGNRGYELRGKTVGIFGFGFMGSAFAEKVRGFGCEVIAYDKYRVGFDSAYVKEVSFEEFKSKTEVLSVNVPLTDETKGLVDYQFLEEFRKLRFVLNTARGEILLLNDLLRHLKEGNLFGAALDVLENEKIDQLSPREKEILDQLANENVLFTPHVAGWTFESYEMINRILVDKIAKLEL